MRVDGALELSCVGITEGDEQDMYVMRRIEDHI